MKSRAVPNPATPRQLRPVELISDRAKRYRANANPPPGPRRCAFCAKSPARDIDHIDGDENNGTGRNLQYLCRPCNTRKGQVQTAAGTGRRTVPPADRSKYARQIAAGKKSRRGDVPF